MTFASIGFQTRHQQTRRERFFIGIDHGGEASPDETTNCKFRYLNKENGIGNTIFLL